VIAWWVGNAVLACVALPLVLVVAFRIIRSLHAVTTATRAIAGSVRSVSGSVPPVMTSMAGIAAGARRLEATVAPPQG
jgi:hypothetical protein